MERIIKTWRKLERNPNESYGEAGEHKTFNVFIDNLSPKTVNRELKS